MASLLSTLLLDWYKENSRKLPWRDHPHPYAVWVSEVMLQQTRVETVIPYFQRWMERFPSVASLAAAPLEEVLSAWEGLGYYSRARNLHRAAQALMSEHNGNLPPDYNALRRLPGLGRYAAAAVASIAFGADLPAVDGNVRRVLARLFEVREDPRSPAGERRLEELAAAHLPAGQAGDFNQALMDLGASVCTPRSPDCNRCPLRGLCRAYVLGAQEELPARRARPVTPHYTVTAAVIHRNGQVLIARRPPEGLLGGLWEFPGGKVEAGEDLSAGLRREIREELESEVEVGKELGVYRHAYSHFRVTLHAFDCRLLGGEPRPLQASQICWVAPKDLGDYPMGKIDRQIANSLC